MKKILMLLVFTSLLSLSTNAKAAPGDIPVITYFVNGIDGMSSIINVNQGDVLNIAWSATNVAYCEKWGIWGAGERLTGLSGTDSQIAPNPTTSVSGFNFQIDCFDINGIHVAQGGAQINVSATPQIPNPTSAPSPKIKGDGIISYIGTDYIVVNNMVIRYDSSTRIKNASRIKIGVNAKWEGVAITTTAVIGSKIEIQ